MSASSFASSVSKLPFSGKYVIENVARSAIRERRVGPKVAKSLGGIALMGFMVAAHAAQTGLGAYIFSHDISMLMDGDQSLLRHAEVTYDALYASANSAVTLAQTYIGYRIGKNLLKTLRNPPQTAPFEVGIDVPIVPSENETHYPSYEVGIENEIQPPAPRKTFSEWRQDNAREIMLARDSVITLGAQALVLGSFVH